MVEQDFFSNRYVLRLELTASEIAPLTWGKKIKSTESWGGAGTRCAAATGARRGVWCRAGPRRRRRRRTKAIKNTIRFELVCFYFAILWWLPESWDYPCPPKKIAIYVLFFLYHASLLLSKNTLFFLRTGINICSVTTVPTPFLSAFAIVLSHFFGLDFI